MKYNRIIRLFLLAGAFTMSIGMLSSCKEDIEIGTVDDSGYKAVDEVRGHLQSMSSSLKQEVIELRKENATALIYCKLTNPMDRAVEISVQVDENVLTDYNTENDTEYEMFPAASVGIAEDGIVKIAASATKSDPLVVTVKPDPTLEVGKTYVLPLSIQSATEGVKLSAMDKSHLYFVKVLGEIPDTKKSTGIVTICYIEVNDNNPLNAGQYTMKSDGKSFIDIVNLFAANINYNAETGRVYVLCNPNVQHILDNRDKYIKPLQDKGIKVCLSILGNHDIAAVSNLAPETARDFARELKVYVDTYGLDGVDFDDEWSDPDDGPGFTDPSGESLARLCYEVRKLMPDKLCLVYAIGSYYMPDVVIEGMLPGDFIDYSYYPYYGSWSGSGYTNINGMEKSQWGPAPIDIASGAYLWNADRLRSEGYGVNLMYNMTNRNYTSNFTTIAKKLYDDEVVFSGNRFPKDW